MTKHKPSLFNKEYQKQWSETHKYKHIHTGEHCTFEAYVAEYLILRWTDSFKMDKPSYKFWTVGDRYHEPFMRNMKALNSLKKKFPENIILEAIRSNHFEKIYHIGLKAYGPRGWKYNPVAIQAITEYNREIEEANELKKTQANTHIEEPVEKEIKTRRTKTTKKQSTINKLRNL
jgi:hypothetical protein